MEEPDFLMELFRRFRASKPGSEAWADIIGFLQELASLGKSLQQIHRTAMLAKLIQLGLFEVGATMAFGACLKQYCWQAESDDLPVHLSRP